ncbi:hypothetical protein BLNAU_22743 [Blattamonas nauphoetae]|uniref:Uncharacterized protein n=1 Tax=Blattamonas nauphoetae TaxID=2049346 RepID=A0ABQ9WV98_9EUKA|nr:hypothetical protein BLNAU_22743 [Blattamonas nauphoetae]
MCRGISLLFRHKWRCGREKSGVDLPFNTGVVSIADLLLSVPSEQTKPTLPVPFVPWHTDSPDFHSCFLMKQDLILGPDTKLEMEVPVGDDRDASTNDGEADVLREGEEGKDK